MVTRSILPLAWSVSLKRGASLLEVRQPPMWRHTHGFTRGNAIEFLRKPSNKQSESKKNSNSSFPYLYLIASSVLNLTWWGQIMIVRKEENDSFKAIFGHLKIFKTRFWRRRRPGTDLKFWNHYRLSVILVFHISRVRWWKLCLNLSVACWSRVQRFFCFIFVERLLQLEGKFRSATVRQEQLISRLVTVLFEKPCLNWNSFRFGLVSFGLVWFGLVSFGLHYTYQKMTFVAKYNRKESL